MNYKEMFVMLQDVSICAKNRKPSLEGISQLICSSFKKKKNDMETKKPEKGNTTVSSLW